MKLLEDRAKKARTHAGISQAEAGRRIGVSREAISQWENGGTKNINSSLLHKASKVYGVNAHWLATGDGVFALIDTTSPVKNISPKKRALLELINNISDDGAETLFVHAEAITRKERNGQ